MRTISLTTEDIKEAAKNLRVYDKVLLSGTVYTARDAAHSRLKEILDDGGEFPFPLMGSVIYYAGPTPTAPGMIIGSCGPTTSARMDKFTPRLLELGLAGMIGKGERSQAVIDSVAKNSSVYFCALGGAGALAAECVKECEVIAFEDLGCESIKRISLKDFPLIVGIDSKGESVFNR